jgi:hypothetical protein
LRELLLRLDFALESELRFEAVLGLEGELCRELVRLLFLYLRAEFGALLLIER